MGKALYRQYRSRTLDEVVGQEHVTELLKNAVKTGHISHAYLFTGPRGVGKTSVARILAHEINGLPYSDDQNMDIIEIDAASNRRIDDIRDLREKVHIAPVATKYKVYIIDEVHMLTGESFNALLKTLEEPPEHVVFILATTEIHKVPATIMSRTQRFHFRAAENTQLAAHLKKIAKKEKIEIDNAALALLAEHSGGSFRDGVSLLDQLHSSEKAITPKVIETLLGLPPKERIAEIVESLTTRNRKGYAKLLKQIEGEGIAASTTAQELMNSLSEKALEEPRLYGLIDKLLDLHLSRYPYLKLLTIGMDFIGHDDKPEDKKPSKSVASTAYVSAPIVSKITTPVKKETPAEPKLKAVTPPQKVGEFNWDNILATIKSHHTPLYSVLSRATVSYEDNVLTLGLSYAIHRKRIDQVAARQQLLTVISDVCGLEPEIKVTDVIRTVVKPELESIAAIMGGGESVDATF